MKETTKQDELYREVAATHGAALERFVRTYEADADRRRDLSQEIHIALWRSFEGFDGRCSQRTWVYRVAHNTAASYVIRERRVKSRELLSLDEVEAQVQPDADKGMALDRLYTLIHQLNPLDRQVMLLYLESMDAASIGEVTGLSAANVATKIHRIKAILARRFHEGGAV